MNERISKWVLASEALLLAIPPTFLFVVWFADQMRWHTSEYLRNLIGLFIAVGLLAGWWLMISFWRGGASHLRSVHTTIWTVAILNGVMSVGICAFLLLASDETRKQPVGIFVFGLPLLVPMIHLVLERGRNVPDI